MADLHPVLAERDWRCRSAEAASKGPRGYEWQWLRTALVPGTAADEAPQDPQTRSLLFRRSCTDPDDWTAYRVHAPATPIGTPWCGWLARGCIERAFEDAKQETGLDEYEVRSAPAGTGTSRWPCGPWPFQATTPALDHLLAWKRHHVWVAQRCRYRRWGALAC